MGYSIDPISVDCYEGKLNWLQERVFLFQSHFNLNFTVALFGCQSQKTYFGATLFPADKLLNRDSIAHLISLLSSYNIILYADKKARPSHEA